MSNYFDTELFDRATKFAVNAHHGVERRGKNFPYILPPMEAANIVSTITTDPELLAAAILHDTVEDTDVTFEQIRDEFGERVAHLVQHETCPLSKSDPWRNRKQAQIDLIAASPYESKVVAMGDKLSNLRAIAMDYCMIGDELWSRFKAPNGKTDIAWYYRRLAEALSDLSDTFPYQEFVMLLDKTFGQENKSL